MMRLVEVALFLSLAGALHLVAFSLPGLDPGGSGGGDGGENSVTLRAAPEQLAALAQSWERAPETSQAPRVTAPRAAMPPIDAPVTRESAPRQSVPQPLAAPADAPPAPQIDSRLPAPGGVQSGPITAPRQPEVAQERARPPAVPPSVQRAAQPPQMPSPEIDSAQIDTAPAAPRHAPARSLRPHARANAKVDAKPQSAQPAQRAKGTGAAPAAPARPSASAAPGPSAAALRSAQAAWGARIRQSVARAQRYPRGTDAQGIVTLRLTLSPAGQLASAQVTGSSGDAALDQAALRAAHAARLPRAPEVLRDARYSFNLPVHFARR